MVDIKDYCTYMNRLSIDLQNDREAIPEEETMRALAYAKKLPIRTAGDVLLFCASVNLMNAYVKQEDHKRTFGYFFKRYVCRLVSILDKRRIEGVSFMVTEHNGMSLVLVSICELQFSYHCVPCRGVYNDNPYLVFDGIHKQPCASALFKLAEENPFLSIEELPEPMSLEKPTGETTKLVPRPGWKSSGLSKYPIATAGESQLKSKSLSEQSSTVTIWKNVPSSRRPKKKANASLPLPSVGDAVTCKVTRFGNTGAYVTHDHGRGLIPFSEMPKEWPDDPRCFIGIGDVLVASVLVTYASGFLKLSGKECEILDEIAL